MVEARERREQESIRATFACELINSQEAERGRIAREQHDSLGQELLLIRNAALLENRTRNPTSGPLADLTPTERRVLRLVGENLTSRDLAKRLGVSPLTIETHRKNICRKLNLSGNHPLLQIALQHRSDL